MIIKELCCEDLLTYYTNVLELLVDTYTINFQLTSEQAKPICLNKIELLMDYINQGSAIVIAAIDENELIGFTWLYKHDFFDEQRLHVNQIAVNTKLRGKGIGKQLFQESEKKALKEGIKTIDLIVSESNSRALDLYEKLGFETERRYMKKKL
ncbi:GNAT family N-acetyltransferase [Peribacillus sp. S4]|uniref:GNAT family N-acetyltransferase n=1 Tax=Peribacillus sp. S4 TaxID=3384451 RepID=UPI00398A06F6